MPRRSITKHVNSPTPLKLLRVGKRYHVFFIHHQQQISFVRDTVKRLEDIYYTCCYEDRDSVPGIPKAEMLITFIKQSMKVVIVLSEAFVGDCRCIYKLYQAMDEFLDQKSENPVPFLVPITVDNCVIPRSLRVISVCDLNKSNWWDCFIKSLQDDDLRVEYNAKSSDGELESAAVVLKEKLNIASAKEMETFLSKPIAFELSHFLSQHSKLSLFISGMKTCGIEFNNKCLTIRLGIFKEFWNRNYHLSNCVKEHLPLLQKQINRVRLIFKYRTDMINRQDFQSMKDFNQLMQAILKTPPSNSTWGIMWNMDGVAYDRSLRDVCRSLIHDAVTEKEVLHIAHPEFALYESRLETLSGWSESRRPSKEAIARAGYYRENAVVFRCFYCNGVSWDFKPDEDPCARHAKWLFNCPYIKELKGLKFVNECRFQNRKFSICNSAFKDLADRLKTYERWPMVSFPKPFDLADAGFYFTGTEDKVVCYMCGYGLRNWTSSDDPYERHAKWSPTCEFITQKKGKSYIQWIQRQRDEKHRNEECSITYSIQIRELNSS